MRADVTGVGPLTYCAIWLIRAYQAVLAPQLGGACRFEPTCSEYAIEALARRGLAAGTWAAARRLLRCHPLGGSGYDPVS